MSFGGSPNQLGFKTKPPEKGAFPLDHFGECKQHMKEYLLCMKKKKNENEACRELSKVYLKCRMDNDLMDKVSFEELGFHKEDEKANQSDENKS